MIRLDTACVRNGWNDEQELESKRKPWYLSTRGHYSIWHGCNSRALVIASPWIQFLVWWHWGQESRKSLALAPPSLESPVNRSMDTFSWLLLLQQQTYSIITMSMYEMKLKDLPVHFALGTFWRKERRHLHLGNQTEKCMSSNDLLLHLANREQSCFDKFRHKTLL